MRKGMLSAKGGKKGGLALLIGRKGVGKNRALSPLGEPRG